MKLVRESLFSSVIRSFCISFFAVIGIFIAFFLVLFVIGAGQNSKATDTSTFDIVIPNTNGRKYAFTSHQPLLLRVDIVGEIAGKGGVSADDVVAILNESRSGPLKNQKIKGILLYINSPGGGSSASSSIYYALKQYALQYQIPIYAYVDGLCASGGMYIACAADKIYSSETSMVGSVGVIGMFFNVSQGMQKIGVQNQTLTAGRNKDAMNPFQPWGENSSASYQNIVNQTYAQFVSVVSQARPKLTPELLINTYGAEVYYAPQAEAYGYIDGAGYQYDEVVEMLAKAAQIDGDNYQMIQMQPKMRLSDLFRMSQMMLRQPKAVDYLKNNLVRFQSPTQFEVLALPVDSAS